MLARPNPDPESYGPFVGNLSQGLESSIEPRSGGSAPEARCPRQGIGGKVGKRRGIDAVSFDPHQRRDMSYRTGFKQ